MSMICVKGSELEQALIRAHHLNYNRSFNDLSRIDPRMQECIENLFKGATASERASVMRNIDNNWRNAYIPVTFLMYHEHKQMERCEKHVRVNVGEGMSMICDLALEDWDRFSDTWFNYLKWRKEQQDKNDE